MVRLNSNFLNSIPEERRKFVKQMFENFSPVDVNSTLSDNQELPYSCGITVIHTPGHTPGHICLYHQLSKTLVVGDAMNIVDGKLTGPRKDILDEGDFDVAVESIKKLLRFDIKSIVCYHGGIYSEDPNEAIQDIISSIE